jgi:hypothetical protein
MSGFMVSDLCISRILEWLYTMQYKEPSVLRTLGDMGFFVENSKQMRVLGNAMLQMNRDAVNQRYNESKKAPEFSFVDCSVSKFQALKSLRCFLYQCNEGDVPEKNPLFKVFDELADYLAMSIVNDLPQYEEAEWG